MKIYTNLSPKTLICDVRFLKIKDANRGSFAELRQAVDKIVRV
jgi:hypothetical protein